MFKEKFLILQKLSKGPGSNKEVESSKSEETKKKESLRKRDDISTLVINLEQELKNVKIKSAEAKAAYEAADTMGKNQIHQDKINARIAEFANLDVDYEFDANADGGGAVVYGDKYIRKTKFLKKSITNYKTFINESDMSNKEKTKALRVVNRFCFRISSITLNKGKEDAFKFDKDLNDHLVAERKDNKVLIASLLPQKLDKPVKPVKPVKPLEPGTKLASNE